MLKKTQALLKAAGDSNEGVRSAAHALAELVKAVPQHREATRKALVEKGYNDLAERL